MVKGKLTTVELFYKYTNFNSDGTIDASGIFSKSCFLEWLARRKTLPKDPCHAYRKVVTGHTRADKGLAPFEEKVEAAVLRELRKKKIWDCFKGTNLRIGLRGYQTSGYWESKASNKRKHEHIEVNGRVKANELVSKKSRVVGCHTNNPSTLSEADIIKYLIMQNSLQLMRETCLPLLPTSSNWLPHQAGLPVLCNLALYSQGAWYEQNQSKISK